MQAANAKHIPVFKVNGSSNQNLDIKVNTIAPIEKPNNLEGHKLPSKWATIYFTEPIYNNEMGTPNKAAVKG